ncbi:MAG: Rrf2 family transcriptional regulator [Ureaplasma sp.]|nr:Rrf2 family transcriptional regulator [Ureaplasma sp.]
MKFSSTFFVGIHSLLMLYYYKDKIKITSNIIASSIGTNPVVVRKVLEKLKAHNLIKIDARKEGIKISKEPNKITLLDILNATGIVEDSLFKVYENTNKECHIGKNINFILYDILIETKLAMEQKLDSITIQDLIDKL